MRRRKRTRIILETSKYIIEMKPIAILAILWFVWVVYDFDWSYKHNFVNSGFIRDWLIVAVSYFAGMILSVSVNIKNKI